MVIKSWVYCCSQCFLSDHRKGNKLNSSNLILGALFLKIDFRNRISASFYTIINRFIFLKSFEQRRQDERIKFIFLLLTDSFFISRLPDGSCMMCFCLLYNKLSLLSTNAFKSILVPCLYFGPLKHLKLTSMPFCWM